MPTISTGAKRLILLGSGYLAFGLALAGVFLPLLPTTPFLLIASYCFVRSSPAAYERLRNHPLTGAFLRDWQAHRAVRRSVKRTAVCVVLVVAAVSLWFTQSQGILQLICLAGTSAGLTILARLPVIPEAAPLPASLPRPGDVSPPA